MRLLALVVDRIAASPRGRELAPPDSAIAASTDHAGMPYASATPRSTRVALPLTTPAITSGDVTTSLGTPLAFIA